MSRGLARRPSPVAIRLAGPVDWAGFVRGGRHAVAHGLPPDVVHWRVGDAGPAADLFDDGHALDAATLPEAPPIGLAPHWRDLLRRVVLHADDDRFDRAYRAVWRLARHDRGADDPLDPERLQLQRMARQVQREAHKMKAFVRFRPIRAGDGEGDGAGLPPEHAEAPPQQVAWFDPLHQVQEWVAPFFVRRFATLRWAILTPRISLRWDGRRLQHGPGAARADAPLPDAGEALWLAYYRSIFNPARLKPDAMRREMPVRYWADLPEARLIAPLMAEATARTGRMVEAEAQPRRRRRGLAAGGAAAPEAG